MFKNLCMAWVCLSFSAYASLPSVLKSSEDYVVETVAGELAEVSLFKNGQLVAQLEGDAVVVTDVKVSQDHILVSGSFAGTLYLDEAVLTARGRTDAFVLVFCRLSGVLLQGTSLGGKGRSLGHGLFRDEQGWNLIGAYDGETFSLPLWSLGNGFGDVDLDGEGVARVAFLEGLGLYFSTGSSGSTMDTGVGTNGETGTEEPPAGGGTQTGDNRTSAS